MSRIFPKGRALLFLQTERNWAVLLSAWGVLSTTMGMIGLFYRPLLIVEGIGLSFLLLGLPSLIVGVRNLVWFLRQAVIIDSMPTHLPKHFLQEEWERVDVLLNLLQRGREICLLFFILGFTLTLMACILNWGSYSLGIGIGLLIQAAFALIYILFWQFRNGLYQHELKVGGH